MRVKTLIYLVEMLVSLNVLIIFLKRLYQSIFSNSFNHVEEELMS